jgi:pyridoxamine 5'-phosphate oxidase
MAFGQKDNTGSAQAKGSTVSIEEIRKEHGRFRLTEADLDPDPLVQFQAWYDAAAESGSAETNAMALATATPEGRPSVRMVLLRGIDERGFTFFTNYESRKASEIEANPYAALVFFWHELERQVRIEGRVERVSDLESDDYFRSRPKGARLGAWASPQSRVVAGREILDALYENLEQQHPDDVPRPPNWGGYRVLPDALEFWQGRTNRLHDRLRYTQAAEGVWLIERLAP